MSYLFAYIPALLRRTAVQLMFRTIAGRRWIFVRIIRRCPWPVWNNGKQSQHILSLLKCKNIRLPSLSSFPALFIDVAPSCAVVVLWFDRGPIWLSLESSLVMDSDSLLRSAVKGTEVEYCMMQLFELELAFREVFILTIAYRHRRYTRLGKQTLSLLELSISFVGLGVCALVWCQISVPSPNYVSVELGVF